MTMRGFESRFRDLPDYILRITEEIWEGGKPELIEDYYHEQCLVHTGMGSAVSGSPAVIAGTIEKMRQFPDREILADDVIWSGDEDRGFLSSHRSMMVQTHLGDGLFGKPTGKRIDIRCIADCACIDNRIYEEWLVVDQAAAAIQAGIEPSVLGASLAAADHAAGAPMPTLTVSEDRPGPDTRELQDDPAAASIRATYQAIWSGQGEAVVERAYSRGVNLHLPTGQDDFGRKPLLDFVASYLASFPDAVFAIDHSMAMREPGRPVRVSTRWTLTGTHSGGGRFGPPSGAPMFVLGITHAELAGDQIAREWTMIDELAVWRRIARHRLALGVA